MAFSLFVILIFWGGLTVGSQACSPADEPSPDPIVIETPVMHGDAP